MRQEIVLSEAAVQSIINGRTVKRKLPDGTEVSIRLSYVKDMAMPVIKDRFEVRDTVVEEHLKNMRLGMSNTFELGN